MLLLSFSGMILFCVLLADVQDIPLPQVPSINLRSSIFYQMDIVFQQKMYSDFRYNLGDYSGEIMSEVMAQRQPLKPTYAIPIIPVTNSSSFKQQEAMELKEYKVKVSNVNNRVIVCATKYTKYNVFIQNTPF